MKPAAQMIIFSFLVAGTKVRPPKRGARTKFRINPTFREPHREFHETYESNIGSLKNSIGGRCFDDESFDSPLETCRSVGPGSILREPNIFL